ncbi:MAG: DUF3090 family protein [Chloroflexi bacterium]|nr:DUF3090 family protein [Chloroflexota bacterium]MCI0888989.1 DUF3090 family protein [Chloroflexota bacterium]
MSSEYRAYARRDLGVCTVLEPEAVGEPGQRFFRLRVEAEHGSALLWIEKEELHELAVMVKRLLRTGVRRTGEPDANGSPDASADVDCKVTGLALGYDRASGRYMLLAHDADPDGEAIALWAEREVLDHMADRAFEVHDAGRPRCPFCGGPTLPGKQHFCARAN